MWPYYQIAWGHKCIYCHVYINFGQIHQCSVTAPVQLPITITIPVALKPLNFKCAFCGSTAIDHTEKQCLKDRETK